MNTLAYRVFYKATQRHPSFNAPIRQNLSRDENQEEWCLANWRQSMQEFKNSTHKVFTYEDKEKILAVDPMFFESLCPADLVLHQIEEYCMFVYK